MTKKRWYVLFAAGTVAAALGGGVAISGASTARHAANGDPGQQILDRIASPRLASIHVQPGSALVSGTATDAADAVRTLWYENLAAAALAQTDPTVAQVTRQVVDASGRLLESEDDATASSSIDAFAPTNAAPSAITNELKARSSAVGATLLGANYVALYGGAPDIVVRPQNEADFLAQSGEKVGFLLGDLAQDHHPYLVTVVDANDDPLLVLGFTPGIGGSIGQGIGWQAPTARSDAIWGAATASATALPSRH